MKKSFLMAAALLLTSLSAWASCPTFKSQYQECHSRSRISAFQVSSVEVSERSPYYRFLLKTKDSSKHLKFVADGEIEEISMQTADGSDLTYTQRAYCADQKLHLEIRSEENFGKESYIFSSSHGDLLIKIYLNSILINEVHCQQ
ncbi:MAG: hypothetical protein NDI69_16725 [Bacteriovoracaceae bacterium]|nr:hypothetical protein [Bacteriovoracaceae bacterium]